jgi:hypothetical protein
MPVGWNPVQDMPDNSIRDLSFCVPICLMAWLARNELVQDVFGSPLREDFYYQAIIEGQHVFLPLKELLNASRSSWASFRLGSMVKTSPGNRRHMTYLETLFLLLLTLPPSDVD